MDKDPIPVAAFSSESVDPGLSCPSAGGLKPDKKDDACAPSRIVEDDDPTSPGMDNDMGTE